MQTIKIENIEIALATKLVDEFLVYLNTQKEVKQGKTNNIEKLFDELKNP